MIVFLTPYQNTDVAADYLPRLGEGLSEVSRVLSFREAVESPALDPGIYVFTGLDRLGEGATRLLTELHTQIQASPGFLALNHPRDTLRRYELLQTLHRENMNGFRALGAWEDLSSLRFPAFVRHRSKDGGVPVLVHSHGQVEAKVGKILMEGGKLSEILVVEFMDTSDSEGYYRKFAAYVVGPRILPVAMDCGRHWVMRRHAAEYTPESLAEEERFASARPHPHEGDLRKVVELSGTGFGRIDYSVLDGRVQTWEINTLPLMRNPPGVAPLPDDIRALRKKRYENFRANFAEAWGELNEGRPQGSPVELQYDEAVVTAGRNELGRERPITYPQGEKFSIPRRLLRPLKPALKPLIAPVLYRRMARAAMKAARATRTVGTGV